MNNLKTAALLAFLGAMFVGLGFLLETLHFDLFSFERFLGNAAVVFERLDSAEL